ncbi:MAG: T9SS type A sorting domain-containing protein [Bacteroidales bacterium]|nr:T9SS type A sorting domain-containing protein [Bacteroidales bacterium]
MEHHVSSSAGGFYNQYSQARLTLYGISGIPNSFFDGITNVLGGSTGTYSAFLSKYNQRIAVPSKFEVAINGFNEGNDFTVVASIENVEPYAGSNIVLHFAVTESGCMYGGTAYNYVTRLMVPSQTGTPLDFSSTTSESVVLDFSLSPTWVLDNCEFIAFVQDMTSKEILQAAKAPANDLMPMYYDNAACLAVNNVPVTNCTGEIAPMVTVACEGATNMTSLDINYQVNEETMNTFNWTGDLAYGESEMVQLPSVSFNIQNENNVVIYTANPNGNPDEDPMNDTTYTSFTSAVEVVPNIYMFLKLDNNPGETTYELKNSAGEVLFSGGPFANALEMVKDTFYLSLDDCYTFYIYDSGDDGLTDGGFFALRESNFNLIYENNDFASSEELVQFSIDLVSVAEREEMESFSVFPNPFNQETHVAFVLESSENAEVILYNLIGEQVLNIPMKEYNAGRNVVTINAAEMPSGIYFVNLKIGDRIFTKKVSVR